MNTNLFATPRSSMPMEFACEHCSRILRVPDGSAGRQSQCPACHHVQQVPEIAGAKRSSRQNAHGAASPKVARTASSGPTKGDGGGGEVSDDRLSIPCPKCKHLLRCTPDQLGSRGRCKQCQHIFTISLDPAVTAANAPVRLVFSCPECHQLFEGREEIRGRKGKCYACQAVFPIVLRPADKLKDAAAGADAGPRVAAGPQPTAPVHSPEKSRPKSQGKAAVPRSRLPDSVGHDAGSSAPTVARREPHQPQPLQPQPEQPQPTKFKLPGAVSTKQTPGASSAAPEAAVLSPAALQQRTLRTHSTAQATPNGQQAPIQFMCSQCHGLMEVPCTSAGMETACPYCHTVQTIPARAQEHEPLESDFSSLDPLTEFSTSPAALQQQWSAQSFGRHRSGLTIGNVFQTTFENLFPSCLLSLLHAMIAGVYAAVALGITFGTLLGLRAMGLSPESMIIAGFTCFGLLALVSVFVGAWFSAAIRHMALRAVRKMPLDIGQAFSPGGAYSVSVLITFITFLCNVLLRLPSIVERLSPGSFGSLAALWVLLMLPVIAIVHMLLSFAWFAAMDGESPGKAVGTSCQLVLKNLPVMIGVKVLVWLMTVALSVLTLGFALILPIYFNATLYNLARKQETL